MSDIFNTTVTFQDLGLRDSVLKGVEAAGFKHPTDIQAKLIAPIMAGKDMIGQAKTGTGKTAAFGLPLLHMADPNIGMQALILVPTRELAAQVTAEINELGKFTPIRATCVIGGESMRHQSKGLRGGAQLIVGTPGRVMDMQDRGEIRFDQTKFVVLDEVDRMLDIGFRDDIRKIMKMLHKDRQTVFTSATISEEIERLGRSFMRPDAEKIITVAGALTVALVEQRYFSVEPWDKKQLLLHLLKHEPQEATVVFCRTKATVHRVATYLHEKGIDCREIHGDLAQNKRNSVMDSMRQGNLDVLVASDLAARGLDIDHISHVINYDLPDDPEVYVHRIGRTARAGRKGVAWAFVSSEQGQMLTEIEKLTGALIEKMHYPDFKPGPIPEDVRLGLPKPRPNVDPMQSLAARATTAPAAEGLSAEEIARRFPGGVIPQSAPKRTLGSKFRSGR